MKSVRGILAVVIGVLASLQVRAAVEIADNVAYAPSATPVETCAWEASMVSSAISNSKKNSAVANTSATVQVPQHTLEVTQLKVSKGTRKTEYSAVVRGNVFHEGKLLATRDFLERETLANEKSTCEALRAVGTAFGESIAEWVSQTRFMECRDECAGIHPDETIVVGAEVLLATVDSLNDTVRNSCRLPTAMISQLIAAHNDEDPPPRAKLESRAIDIEKYPGRRLVLRVDNVHAIGGYVSSGPKWMNMSGELWDGKSLVATFKSHSHTIGGITTCRAVNTLTDSTARMIADWLRSPSLGAKL